ncbi:MAG: methyltransferase domain-containing protein [Candidatus Aenigmarchaeota archaeon]|nr:methyltransferase domain-containing protein [Candidatus Aenigmarchaeota archaeon]
MNNENNNILDQRIREYLAQNGIAELSREEVKNKIECLSGMDFLELKNRFQVHELPDFYEIGQSGRDNYNYRIAFLKWMVNFIDSYPIGDCSILDSGCATGLDLCFLAGHYKDRDKIFKGYDKQEGMIFLAKEKAKRLSLKNVEFYVSDHDLDIVNPDSSEICSVDVLYNNNSLGLPEMRAENKTEAVEEIDRVQASRIANVLSRVKSGGTGIIGGVYTGKVDSLLPRLENRGIVYVRGEKIFNTPLGLEYFNQVFEIHR